MLGKNQPIAIYMEGALADFSGKMGFGILRYSPNPIACVIDSTHAGQLVGEITGIPRSTPIVASIEAAKQLGAEVVVLGIAPPGGKIPEAWLPVMDRAVELGLSLVNGLHTLLGPRYSKLQPGQWIWDIRQEPQNLGVNTGFAATLNNRRVLMIGTDMAIGKMTAGLEIYADAIRRGVHAEFIATGQIGITVMGSGVPLDAIRVDYASGAIEGEIRKVAEAELIVVEGQGALCHPGSTANLPLLRGSMPTDLVLCHKWGLTHLQKMPNIRIPELGEYVKLYQDLADSCGTFVRPRWSGICLNTSALTEDEASSAMKSLEEKYQVTVCDPVRFGVGELVPRLMS